MVKDEMVKQGKSRGTGRPGKILKQNRGILCCWQAQVYQTNWFREAHISIVRHKNHFKGP